MPDKIITSPQNEKYRKGWEKAFGHSKKKPKKKPLDEENIDFGREGLKGAARAFLKRMEKELDAWERAQRAIVSGKQIITNREID